MVWAVANSNLALVKYWGKADEGAKHPASPSLSVTLDGLTTAAGVELTRELSADVVEGLPPSVVPKVERFLDAFREGFGVRSRARIVLASNFPVAAGLASSASTFAALARAITAAAGIEVDDGELAEVARLGSGSACRSVHGGFVEWRPQGAGSIVEPIASKSHWERLRIVIAVTSKRPKSVGSSEGMRRTVATSPYYRAWIEGGRSDLEDVRAGVHGRDLERVGAAAERNCLRMHAAALGSNPPLLYWEAATVAAMRRVWQLREEGIGAYFSIDAGPQVKVLCDVESEPAVKAALAAVPGVLRIIVSRPGDGARIVERAPHWVAPPAPSARAEAAAS